MMEVLGMRLVRCFNSLFMVSVFLVMFAMLGATAHASENIYNTSFTVPSGASKLKAGTYWYGNSSDSNCTISLYNGTGIIDEYSDLVTTVVRDFETINITLPVIDYTITMTSGYREMTLDSPTPGSWELRVQHNNVTKIDTEIGWS